MRAFFYSVEVLITILSLHNTYLQIRKLFDIKSINLKIFMTFFIIFFSFFRERRLGMLLHAKLCQRLLMIKEISVCHKIERDLKHEYPTRNLRINDWYAVSNVAMVQRG